MTEQTKTRLAIANGLGEERRKERTAQEIGNIYSPSKEIGILGDAMEYMFSLVADLHENVEADPTFVEWRTKVATIKQQIQNEINNIERTLNE